MSRATETFYTDVIDQTISALHADFNAEGVPPEVVDYLRRSWIEKLANSQVFAAPEEPEDSNDFQLPNGLQSLLAGVMSTNTSGAATGYADQADIAPQTPSAHLAAVIPLLALSSSMPARPATTLSYPHSELSSATDFLFAPTGPASASAGASHLPYPHTDAAGGGTAGPGSIFLPIPSTPTAALHVGPAPSLGSGGGAAESAAQRNGEGLGTPSTAGDAGAARAAAAASSSSPSPSGGEEGSGSTGANTGRRRAAADDGTASANGNGSGSSNGHGNSEENENENDEELGSDLDDEEDDDEEPDGSQAGNLVLCMAEKVNRVRNRWKIAMQGGVITLDGRDYVFNKANGDFFF